MIAPAGSAAAFREARKGKPIGNLSRADSLKNMKELIANGEASAPADINAVPAGVESMVRELARQGMEPKR